MVASHNTRSGIADHGVLDDDRWPVFDAGGMNQSLIFDQG